MKQSIAALAVLACIACASTARSSGGDGVAPSNDLVIPTRYVNDRWFATAVLARGDTATFFLDTGVPYSRVWDSYLPYLELAATDSITHREIGFKTAVTAFPQFRPDASLPPAIAQSAQGTGLIVWPVDSRGPNSFA